MTKTAILEATAASNSSQTPCMRRELCATWAIDPTTGRPAARWGVAASDLYQDICLQSSRIEPQSSPLPARNQKGKSMDIIGALLIAAGAAVGCWMFWQSPYADYPAADYAGTIFSAMTGVLTGFVVAGLVVMPIREAIKRRSRGYVRWPTKSLSS